MPQAKKEEKQTYYAGFEGMILGRYFKKGEPLLAYPREVRYLKMAGAVTDEAPNDRAAKKEPADPAQTAASDERPAIVNPTEPDADARTSLDGRAHTTRRK